MNPFAGLDHEDPFAHLTKLYELASTLGSSKAEEGAIFMILFPHSLIGKAKYRYLDQPVQIMTNWNILEEKFLSWLFPYNKFLDAKTAITVFAQGSAETLCKAWERYKSMLIKCPSHSFDDITQLHILRNGLQAQIKLLLDETTSGSLMSKSTEDAISIIDHMALIDH